MEKLVFDLKTLACVVTLQAAVSGIAQAQPRTDTPAPTAPSTAAATATATGPAVELNKLETFDKGCRAYMVINNPTVSSYTGFKLDLVLFQTDGVIGRRFALDLAPLKPNKKSVKLFELDGIACDKIGSFLINDVMECKSDDGTATDCLQKLGTSTLTNVQISK